MTTMPERRCGTCALWHYDKFGITTGCKWEPTEPTPMPFDGTRLDRLDHLRQLLGLTYARSYDGITCPCYRPREERSEP